MGEGVGVRERYGFAFYSGLVFPAKNTVGIVNFWPEKHMEYFGDGDQLGVLNGFDWIIPL